MADPKFAVGEKVRIIGGKNHNRVTEVTKRLHSKHHVGTKFEWWYFVAKTTGGSGRPFPEFRLRPYDPPEEEAGSWDELKGIWQPPELNEKEKKPEPVEVE